MRTCGFENFNKWSFNFFEDMEQGIRGRETIKGKNQKVKFLLLCLFSRCYFSRPGDMRCFSILNVRELRVFLKYLPVH